jgi:ferredoxin
MELASGFVETAHRVVQDCGGDYPAFLPLPSRILAKKNSHGPSGIGAFDDGRRPLYSIARRLRTHPERERKLMKVAVDAEACVGCGLCESTCPEVFEMDDSVAKVKVEEVPAAAEATCRDAVSACPVEAIKIVG